MQRCIASSRHRLSFLPPKRTCLLALPSVLLLSSAPFCLRLGKNQPSIRSTSPVTASTSSQAAVVMSASPITYNGFVYGTLIAPEVLQLVIGRVPEMKDATLPGYRRYGLRGRAYPGIVKDPPSSVRGRVLLGLTQNEMDLLDEYEGNDYTREKVTVELGGGATLEAGVYVWKHPSEFQGEWDYEAFRKSRGFDRYVQGIQQWMESGKESEQEYLEPK